MTEIKVGIFLGGSGGGPKDLFETTMQCYSDCAWAIQGYDLLLQICSSAFVDDLSRNQQGQQSHTKGLMIMFTNISSATICEKGNHS